MQKETRDYCMPCVFMRIRSHSWIFLLEYVEHTTKSARISHTKYTLKIKGSQFNRGANVRIKVARG